jgi:3-hexulose-6-phosphate synthase/6-phospho-3-hexuloisomerase
MEPVLQLALDFVDLKRAMKNAEAAVAGGADWLEAGTPLIKSEGLEAVRELRRLFPRATIVADMKIMDAGRIEVETAAKAGANIVDVLGAASDATIRECVQAGKNYGAKIVVDLIAVADPVRRAKEIEGFGADYVTVHCAIDEQMEGKNPFETLRRIAENVSVPVGVAGGINSETVPLALEAGASIVIVGGAITKAVDPKDAAGTIKKAMREKVAIPTTLFKRVSGEEIRKILEQVSAANLSDALHRGGVLDGLQPLFKDPLKLSIWLKRVTSSLLTPVVWGRPCGANWPPILPCSVDWQGWSLTGLYAIPTISAS